MPYYISEPIPKLSESKYTFRNQPVIGEIKARTEKSKANFSPNSSYEWSKLDFETRKSPTNYMFKSKLLSLIRPLFNSVFGIYYPPRRLALLLAT